jgi:hypothetical protein
MRKHMVMTCHEQNQKPIFSLSFIFYPKFREPCRLREDELVSNVNYNLLIQIVFLQIAMLFPLNNKNLSACTSSKRSQVTK